MDVAEEVQEGSRASPCTLQGGALAPPPPPPPCRWDNCVPICQWLRRAAVGRIAHQVVRGSPESYFKRHLESLLWAFLRQAVRVPEDFPSLGDAVQQAPAWPPTTILVDGGAHSVDVTLDKPVCIVGRGFPVLRAPADCLAMLQASCAGEVGPELRGLRLESGPTSILVKSGNLAVRSCSITSARGSGIVATDSSSVTVANCELGANGLASLTVKDHAKATLTNTRFLDNNGAGLHLKGDAKASVVNCVFCNHRLPAILAQGSSEGVFRKNRFEHNKGGGAMVSGKAQVVVEDNVLTGHKLPAILIRDEATGAMRRNALYDNDGVGILLSHKTRIVVEGNNLSNNRRAADVIEFKEATGVVVKAKIVNTRTDETNGLTHELSFISGKSGREWVALDEKKQVLRNISGAADVSFSVKDRMLSGTAADGEGGILQQASMSKGVRRAAIAVLDESEATVRWNELDGNMGYGILVCNSAKPLVEENRISKNGKSAIVICGEAAGVVRRNRLSDNSCIGIDVKGSARPVVEDNVVERNGGVGILVRDSASPAAIRGNALSGTASSSMPIVIANTCKEVECRVDKNTHNGGPVGAKRALLQASTAAPAGKRQHL